MFYRSRNSSSSSDVFVRIANRVLNRIPTLDYLSSLIIIASNLCPFGDGKC